MVEGDRDRDRDREVGGELHSVALGFCIQALGVLGFVVLHLRSISHIC